MINICRRHKSQSPELLWWVGRKKEEISFSPSQNTLNMFHCCFSSSHCDVLKFAVQSQKVRYNHYATDLLLKQLPSNENSVEAVLSLVPVMYFAAKDSMSDFWKVALWCSVFPESGFVFKYWNNIWQELVGYSLQLRRSRCMKNFSKFCHSSQGRFNLSTIFSKLFSVRPSDLPLKV